MSGGILFEGGRGVRNEIARSHKRDLITYRDNVVAVVSSEFPEIDGWYRLLSIDLRVDGPWKMFPFTFELEFVGTAHDLRWESRIIGATASNDFSITTSEVTHAPPINHKGYEVRETTSVNRAVAYDDPIKVYRNLTLVDSKISKLFSIGPNDFYRGAATVSRRDPLLPEYGPISGTVAHIENIEDIEIGNGIVRFWIQAATPFIGFWDGTAWRDYGIFFVGEGSATVPVWNYVAILKNNPEECILRYEGGTVGAVSLTVALRRGDLGISVVLTSDVVTRLGVFDALTTNMTVTSNRSFYTSADAYGHKLGFVSMHSFTSVAVDGYIYVDGADRFDAFITNELSGAAVGNQAAALGAQYMSAQAEEIRAVLR